MRSSAALLMAGNMLKTFERIQHTRETTIMTIEKIIPRDWNILLSKGAHEPNQLIAAK